MIGIAKDDSRTTTPRTTGRNGQMDEEARILAALDGLAAGFNAHDIDAIMGFFDDDCSLDLPRGPDPHGSRYLGRDEVRRGILTRFESTLDVHYGEVENFAAGNTGISRWLLTGTQPTGETVRVRGCDIYTFRNGKVSRKDSYWKIVDRQADRPRASGRG
jgi:ketosteroid isomerase-like protein